MKATWIAAVVVGLGTAGSSIAQQPGPVAPVQPAPGPLEPPKFQPAPIPESVAESVKKSVNEKADPFESETSLGAAPAAAARPAATPAPKPAAAATAAPTTTVANSAPATSTAAATGAPATGSIMNSLAAPAPESTPTPTIQQTTVPDATPGVTPSTPTPAPPGAGARALPPRSPSQYEDVQPRAEPSVARRAPEPYRPFAGPNLGLQAGGGLATFGSSQMQELTGAGGYWDVRMVMGLGRLFAFELAYVGSTTPLAAPGVASGASLMGHGAEGALRLNIPLVSRDGAYVIPFGVVGMGWQRYRVVNGDTNGTVVAKQDDVSTIPYGGGVTLGYRHLYLDTRFIYRTSQYEDLLTSGHQTRGELRQWTLGGNVGYLF